jgi:PAS domain S-box-containing protein
VRNESKEITGAVVIQMDITDQVNVEAALRQSEARFQAMTNAMPQMVWATQPEQETDYFNDRILEFTGQPKEAVTGDGWANFIHPDDITGASLAWQHALANGTPLEDEYRLRHHSGEYRWVLGRALPLRRDDGTNHWIGTFTDIHDQKLAAEQLQVANKRKDEFLAMLAHELRNPLAPVANAVQLLRLCAKNDTRVQEVTDIIERQTTHMAELVNDLLDVSRITQGLVELHYSPVDMKLVVAQAIEQVRPLIEAKGHTLHTTITAEQAIVIGDQTRLIQALSNILTNAAKYTANDGQIKLQCSVKTHEIKISVQDNGAGIDASLLPYVFDLFTQAQRTPDRAQGGLGLGLTLVKRIVELHSGNVVAESDGQGQGSTFKVLLPLANVDNTPAKAFMGDVTTAYALKARRILVVDDNTDAAQSLAMLLEGYGYEVFTAADGVEGLEVALSHSPEVVILDIGLPDMDGYELARRLRAEDETKNTVLLALTGYGQEQNKTLAKTAGFDSYLVKPVNFQELKKLIEQ